MSLTMLSSRAPFDNDRIHILFLLTNPIQLFFDPFVIFIDELLITISVVHILNVQLRRCPDFNSTQQNINSWK